MIYRLFLLCNVYLLMAIIFHISDYTIPNGMNFLLIFL